MGHKTVFRLICPDCNHKWRWPGDQELPSFCPKCATSLAVPDPDFVPSKLNIGTVTGKSGDWAYRKLEADSEARAEAALPAIEQQLVEAGIPVEQAQRMAAQQASEIKVTNMRDGMREGDVAAMPTASPVYQQQVTSLGGDPNGSFVGGMSVAGAGPAPVNESGAKVMQAIQGGAWRSKAPTANANVAGLRGGFGKAG
jgi:hypothetical protein